MELFGQADLSFSFSFPHTQRGCSRRPELADLYRACDLGLVFSTTNYSLIPLEMMACALPVVEIDTPSTRAVFTDGEVTLAKPSPYEIADAIEALLADPARRAEQVRRGRRFVEGTSWERSARAIEAAILERLRTSGFSAMDTESLAAPPIYHPPKATIFIPTFNAGPRFEGVLQAVTNQVCDFDLRCPDHR